METSGKHIGIGGALLSQVGGGVTAAIIDRKFADKSVTIGPVTLTPGAMGALGLAALAFAGVRIPGGRVVAEVAANFAGGALVYEGTKLGEQQAVPLLEKFFPGLLGAPPAPALPAGQPVAGEDYVRGEPYDEGDPFLVTGIPSMQGDLADSLAAWRSMAA